MNAALSSHWKAQEAVRPVIVRCRADQWNDSRRPEVCLEGSSNTRLPHQHKTQHWDCRLVPAARRPPCEASEAPTGLQGQGSQQRPEQAAEGLLPPPWQVIRPPGVTSRAARSQGGCGEALETGAATSPWLAPHGLLQCHHSSCLVPAGASLLTQPVKCV